MKRIIETWRTWRHARKFAKVGRRCRFHGAFIEVDGHVEIGDESKIRNNVILRTRGDGKILMGVHSGLSYYCMVEATTTVKIGSFTGIAEFTVIRDTNHMVFGTLDHWRLTPHIAEPIVIGDCVLVTSRCYIGPGVAIGDGAVIAPNSYVTKDIGPYEVWAGNPARKVGHRTEGLVADAMRKRYGVLLEAFGLQEDKYRHDLATIRARVDEGVNQAAAERDRLMEAYRRRKGAQLPETDLDDINGA